MANTRDKVYTERIPAVAVTPKTKMDLLTLATEANITQSEVVRNALDAMLETWRRSRERDAYQRAGSASSPTTSSD